MPGAKYFIAIVLPEPTQGRIEDMKQHLFQQHQLKGALRSPAHITLHRPFEWKEEKEQNLIDALKGFKFESVFEIDLKNFGFFEPRVLFVDVEITSYLLNLHDKLVKYVKKELRLFNEAEDLRGFHPHVTIAFRDLKKPLFYKLQEEFKNKTFKDKFQCINFSLLKLEQKWEVLHNFPI